MHNVLRAFVFKKLYPLCLYHLNLNTGKPSIFSGTAHPMKQPCWSTAKLNCEKSNEGHILDNWWLNSGRMVKRERHTIDRSLPEPIPTRYLRIHAALGGDELNVYSMFSMYIVNNIWRTLHMMPCKPWISLCGTNKTQIDLTYRKGNSLMFHHKHIYILILRFILQSFCILHI